jgi:hypothetical protein
VSSGEAAYTYWITLCPWSDHRSNAQSIANNDFHYSTKSSAVKHMSLHTEYNGAYLRTKTEYHGNLSDGCVKEEMLSGRHISALLNSSRDQRLWTCHTLKQFLLFYSFGIYNCKLLNILHSTIIDHMIYLCLLVWCSGFVHIFFSHYNEYLY